MKKRYIPLFITIAALALSGCGKSALAPALSQSQDQAKEISAESETAEAIDYASAQNADSASQPTDTTSVPESESDQNSDTEVKSSEESSALFKETLMKEAGVTAEEIRFYHESDFDNDGNFEAFALIGSEPDYDFDENGLVEGKIWFANNDEAYAFDRGMGMGFENRDVLLDFETKQYVVFHDVYATGAQSFAFEVNGKEVTEPEFSGCGTIYKDNDGDDYFRIIDSNYDMMYDPQIGSTIGHTWKSYYFYFDRAEGTVKEYAGGEITQDKAKELAGKDLVAECLTSKDQLENILYRKNGLIHVNYNTPEEDGTISYYHRTWNLEKGVYIDDYTQESDEPQGGHYGQALCPPIAELP